ncbi:MAG: sensor domain-containing diguanylate cyclase [Bacillota bacterium]
MDKVKLSLLVTILLVLLLGNLAYGATEPIAEKGIIDLNNWNFDSQGSIELNGEWKTYSQSLYSPQEVEEASYDFLSEPGLWQNYSFLDTKFYFLKEMKKGYATHQLVIQNNNNPGIKAIRIGEIANSYKVWINGELAVENGQVANQTDLEVPQLKERIVKLPSTDKINLVIQVSNFHFNEKRFVNQLEKIKLGTPNQLRQVDYITPILFAVTLIMFIVFFFAYLFRGRASEFLYFSFFNLVLSLKVAVVSNLFDINLIDKLSYWYLAKINVLLMVLTLVFFASYLKTLYQNLISGFVYKTILGVSSVFSIVILASSVEIYNGTFIYVQFIVGFLLLYLAYSAVVGLLREEFSFFITMVLLISLILVYTYNLFVNDFILVAVCSLFLMLLILYQTIYLIKDYFKSMTEYKKESNKREKSENLTKIISSLHSSLDSEQVARLATRKLTKIIHYDAIAIMGKERKCLQELVIRGERNLESERIKISENELFSDLMNRKSPMIVNDVSDFPWFGKYGKLTGIKSWLGMPLFVEDELVGILTIGNKDVREYSEVVQRSIIRFCQELAVALQNSYKFSELEELAAKDGLTGLYNRDAFKELAIKEYHQAIRYNHDLSLVLIDLDQYQEIINEFDYGIADEIVKIFAQRCEESIRTADYMGRYHGVKLGILLTDTGLFGAKELAQRLKGAVNKVINIDGQGDIFVSASYGISTVEEKVGVDTLFKLADSALVKAQNEGGDCIKTIKD